MENSGFEFRVWDNIHEIMMKLSEVNTYSTIDIISNVFKESLNVMQYTGLKDKNGVKVFQGDIVEAMQEYELGEDKWYGIGEVEFYNGSFVFRYKIDDSWGLLTGFDEIEVIGNKFENPELLGENK